MIFRQFFDAQSCTYTYLLAAAPGGEALIIDPVLAKVDLYIRLLQELDLVLVKTVETHVHADHVTGSAALRDRTRCITVMGRASQVDRVSMRVDDGDQICIDGLSLGVLHTPGHTDDSYCFTFDDRVFTGDTLLIRGTGRTDFQNGDPYAAYRSLFGKLLTLPDETLVYPGHDYKGETVSTIGEERAFNPRLQVKNADDYAAVMNGLDLPNPKMMDVAVPANLHIGLDTAREVRRNEALDAHTLMARLDDPHMVVVDLREAAERARTGVIPGSVHVPYARLADAAAADGLLRALAARAPKMVLYCAFGERSALGLATLHDAGFSGLQHLEGGIDAWQAAGGPLVPSAP